MVLDLFQDCVVQGVCSRKFPAYKIASDALGVCEKFRESDEAASLQSKQKPPRRERRNFACHFFVQLFKAYNTFQQHCIGENVQERLTLKHKNTSRWARRALKRGTDLVDDGTKAAIAEQLRLGQELRKRVGQSNKLMLSRLKMPCTMC